ncbi:MAG: hypothetical protein K8S98_01985 [Planctomycetes bacterium]|nr:hypothetical protein [Planctomycetota bacterium]
MVAAGRRSGRIVPREWRRAAWLAVALGACRTTPPRSGDELARADVRRTLDALYVSFGFDAGGEADWTTLRSLALDGAAWVDPIAPGVTPRAVGTDAFVAGFRAAIHASADLRDGFHERILHARIDLFGTVAHAYVAFEGFVRDGVPARTRGLDSIQLVRDGDAWKVASFTTQYESPDAKLPARFLRDE